MVDKIMWRKTNKKDKVNIEYIIVIVLFENEHFAVILRFQLSLF